MVKNVLILSTSFPDDYDCEISYRTITLTLTHLFLGNIRERGYVVQRFTFFAHEGATGQIRIVETA